MDMAAVAWLSAFVQCYTHGSFWAGHSAAKTKSSSALQETDACGVDAIQALTGCTIGKGNLIFQMQGKNAFSSIGAVTEPLFRLVLRATPEKSKEERLAWLMDGDYHEMFDVKPVPGPVPEAAQDFKSCTCSVCGERFAENFAHLQDGEIVCSGCFRPYSRGL